MCMERPGNVRDTLIQYWGLNQPTFTNVFKPAQAVGSTPTYRVDYLPAADGYPAAVQFFVNGVSQKIDWAGFTPTNAQHSGEINTLSTQMPGGTSEKERFTNEKVQFLSSGGIPGSGPYVDFEGVGRILAYNPGTQQYFTPPDVFGNTKVSATELQIWDMACAT